MKRFCRRALALLFILSLLLTLTLSALAQEPGDSEDPAPEETGEPAPAEPTPTPAQEDPGQESEETPEPEEEALPLTQQEIYVSRDGSDENGNGSEQAPFRTLARAAGMANQLPELPAYIFLMTDLEMKESARFLGRSVILLSAGDKPVTVTRAEGFKPVKDEGGQAYNPAMIELRAPKDAERPAGSLLLMGVILDDAGRHEGSVFDPIPAAEEEPAPAPEEDAEPAPEGEAPAENTAEPAPETEEPAAPAADVQTQSGGSPAESDQEERPARVQDAIVSVGDGGSLTLGKGAELRNFGGLSAVHLGEESQLTLEPESAIRDTLEASNQRPAVLLPESAKVELLEGAKLLERFPSADSPSGIGDVLPGGNLEFSSLELKAPETLTRDEAILIRYEIPYELSFTVSDTVKKLIESMKDSLNAADGTITITLDSRMVGDVILFQTEPKLNSQVFELDGAVAYDETNRVITAKFKLKEDWKDHLDSLAEPITFTCKGYLPIDQFEASTETEDKYLTTRGKVSLTLDYTLGSENKSSTVDSQEKTAKTKMLGLPLSRVIYDVNGGDIGSGPVFELVSAQKEYPLKTEPAPTHAPVDGDDVVFLGWSEEPDKTIYERKTDDNDQGTPALIETVPVPTLGEVRVYAVYSKDINGDGIPDYKQKIAILSFDGNSDDAKNVPEPILHVVLSTSSGELGVDIPEQEPDRIYYTFVGWSEKPDASDTDKDLYKYDAEKASRRDIPVTKDKTLYAVWKGNYKIVYDANGGQNAPDPSVVPYQTKVTGEDGKSYYTGRAEITTGAPTRTGYEFKGWTTSRRGSAAYFAGDEVQISKGDVTLYAVWVRTGGGGGTAAPKTGDADMGIYAVLLGVSVLALAGGGFFLWRRKRSE